MPMPSVTLEFQSPYDVCARCGRGRSAHGQYGNEACGLFTKKEAAAAHSPGPWKTCAASHGKCSCGLIWDATGDWATAIVQQNSEELGAEIPPETAWANGRLIAAAPELVAMLRKVTEKLRGLMESEFEGADKEAFRKKLERQGVLEAEALLKRIDEGTPKLIDHGSTGHHFVKDGGRRPWTLVGFEMRDGERVAVFHSCGHPSQVTTAPESEFPRWSEVTAEEADAMIPKGAPP